MASGFMAELREKIDAEFENLERVAQGLPAVSALNKLSPLELNGVAVLVHNFYNGVENILKQMALASSLRLPDGPMWHRDLLDSASAQRFISGDTAERLEGFETNALRFRKRCRHPLRLYRENSSKARQF